MLAPSEPLPFQLDEEGVDETLRIHHRYLDLRRPAMQRIQKIRVDVTRIMRRYLEDRGFWELETPMLTRSTPEGARDFLVPARLDPGSFYALPQSPQLFKQLLMCAGYERYYQIARCFRDEAQRADRQLEFTQLDIEMSFVEREEVLAVVEGLYAEIWKQMLGVEIELPFPRLSYADAMRRYGSDKPDLRYGLEIGDVSEAVASSEFGVFRSAVASGGIVRAIAVPDATVTRKDIDELQAFAKEWGGKGLAHLIIEPDGDAALADREVPLRGRGRRDPRGHRRRPGLGRVPRRRLGADRQPGARRAALAPRRALRPDRPRRLEVPVRRRLPALPARRRDGWLGGRAPHVHGAGQGARGACSSATRAR